MAVQNTTFTIFSGNNITLRFTVRDDAGVIVDITGAALRYDLFKLDPNIVDPSPKTSTGALPAEKTVGSGITIPVGTDGIFNVALVPSDTATLVGSFYHEVEMILSGNTTTLEYGRMDIKADGLK